MNKQILALIAQQKSTVWVAGQDLKRNVKGSGSWVTAVANMQVDETFEPLYTQADMAALVEMMVRDCSAIAAFRDSVVAKTIKIHYGVDE